MIKVFWFILWIGTIVFGISYFRMRDKIPIQRRNKIEIAVMIIMTIFLIINIFSVALERKQTTEEINDCIRFYRYFPDFQKQDEFLFLNKCEEYFDEEKIQKLRDSCFAWKKKQSEKGILWNYDFDIVEGGDENE